jgi:hypothetical protein
VWDRLLTKPTKNPQLGLSRSLRTYQQHSSGMFVEGKWFRTLAYAFKKQKTKGNGMTSEKNQGKGKITMGNK